MIIPIPALKDNYIWLLCHQQSAVVVDPGEADPVLRYLQQHQLQLKAILATHHHNDHVGGIPSLLQYYDVPVYAPRHEIILGVTHPLSEKDTITLTELELSLKVINIPGHTKGHIAYYGEPYLFCGDTLFACGCGKLFEGTPQQMYASLQKLAALPDATLIYCGHEYTLANIRFAKAVEPTNKQLLAREQQTIAKRSQNQPTLPSTLGLEKATNPFLRCEERSIITAANRYSGKMLSDPVSVFATVRQWKNQF